MVDDASDYEYDWGRESAGESERDIHFRVQVYIPSSKVWRNVIHWQHIDRNWVCERHFFHFEEWKDDELSSELIEWKCPSLKKSSSSEPIIFNRAEIYGWSVLQSKGLNARELHDGEPDDYFVGCNDTFYQLEGMKIGGKQVTDDADPPVIFPHADPSPSVYADIPEETDEMTCSVCPYLMYHLQAAWNLFRYVPPHLIGPDYFTEWEDNNNTADSGRWTLERRLTYRSKRLKLLLRPLLPFEDDILDKILTFLPPPRPNRIRIHKFVW